jgi:hypothetical protein
MECGIRDAAFTRAPDWIKSGDAVSALQSIARRISPAAEPPWSAGIRDAAFACTPPLARARTITPGTDCAQQAPGTEHQ